MKKIIKFVSLLTVNVLLINNIIGCSFSDSSASIIPIPPGPPFPNTKTIDDYNKDIESSEKIIKKVRKGLSHTHEITDKDLKKYARHMYKGTISQYCAQIKDDRYQILLLEYDNNLPKDEKKQAKKILNAELTGLTKEIKFLNDKSLHGDAASQVKLAEQQKTLVNQELKNL